MNIISFLKYSKKFQNFIHCILSFCMYTSSSQLKTENKMYMGAMTISYCHLPTWYHLFVFFALYLPLYVFEYVIRTRSTFTCFFWIISILELLKNFQWCIFTEVLVSLNSKRNTTSCIHYHKIIIIIKNESRSQQSSYITYFFHQFQKHYSSILFIDFKFSIFQLWSFESNCIAYTKFLRV